MSKWNYFQVMNIDSYGFLDHKVDFGFNAQAISFLNRGSHTLEYSFNGVDLHGDLVPGDPSAGLFFDSRTESVAFFRAADGYSVIRIEAWR